MNRKKDPKKTSFYDTIIDIRRVVKVVKGGRIFSFSVLAIIGNKKGSYGIGKGKALDITQAKKKAISMARNNVIKINLRAGRTLHHTVTGKFGASKVILRPSQPGTGVVAGGAVRALLESIGVQDVVTKIIGSANPHTTLLATAEALSQTQSLRSIALLRSKSIKDIVANIRQRKSYDGNDISENKEDESVTA
ncbi:MAG: small subunit ribosomal protein S5 [Candidatus Deianiraeaceae bacterium]|jgi:small subunit ribosomal protein S5